MISPVLLIAGGALGVYSLARKKSDAPNPAPAPTTAATEPADPSAKEGTPTTGTIVISDPVRPQGIKTVSVGGVATTTTQAGTTLVEPGFEVDGEGCADANGEPISCAELERRTKLAMRSGDPIYS